MCEASVSLPAQEGVWGGRERGNSEQSQPRGGCLETALSFLMIFNWV